MGFCQREREQAQKNEDDGEEDEKIDEAKAMKKFNIWRSIQPWSKHKFSIAYTHIHKYDSAWSVRSRIQQPNSPAIRSFSVSKMKHKSAKSFKKLFISPWFFSFSISLVVYCAGTGLANALSQDNTECLLNFFFTLPWRTRNALAQKHKQTLVRSPVRSFSHHSEILWNENIEVYSKICFIQNVCAA